MSEYRNHRRTVTLLLEDVTDALASEFFERLVGTDVTLTLSDGLEYDASVEAVALEDKHET